MCVCVEGYTNEVLIVEEEVEAEVEEESCSLLEFVEEDTVAVFLFVSVSCIRSPLSL